MLIAILRPTLLFNVLQINSLFIAMAFNAGGAIPIYAIDDFFAKWVI